MGAAKGGWGETASMYYYQNPIRHVENLTILKNRGQKTTFIIRELSKGQNVGLL